MATITNSVLVESAERGTMKRNLYRYTLDNGEVHERRGWIATGADNTADMNARGIAALTELAEAEIERILNGDVLG